MGIDGGCFESIESLLKKELLPNFKKLLDNGFSSKLKVTVPPITIPSWPCLFSGLTPNQLGYFWFDHPKKGLFNSSVWQKKSIFSLENLRVFALNIPGTYPAWKINGEIISGMMSPSLSCYPLELKFILKNNWILDGKTISECFRAFEIKKRLFIRKLKEHFDLMIFVIRLPDSLSHHAHLSRERVLNYMELGYKKIDDFIGEILKNNNFDNLLIFSDHGLKSYNYEFNINRWLEKKGLLFINTSKGGKLYSLIAKLYDIIRPILKIDYKKYHALKKTLLKNIIDDSIIIRNKNIKTKTLGFFGNTGGIFLDRNDTIKKSTIKKMLEKEKKVIEVKTSNIDGFPDLIVILDDKYIFSHESSLFVIRGRNSINHSQYGLFLAYGKDIKKGNLDLVNFIDIAPTVLKLFGINKINYMKGNILNIFKN